MSALPLLLECSTISRLCKPSHHPHSPCLTHSTKDQTLPPLFRAISPLLPSTWQNNIARRLGVVERKRTPPPWGSSAHSAPSSPTPLASGSVSVCQLLVFPPVRSRSLFGIALKEVLVWPRLSTGDRKGQRLRKGGRCTHHRPTQEPDCRRTTGDSCEERSTRKQRGLCPNDPTTIAGGECWERSTVGYRVIVVLSASSSFDVVSPETENAI